MITKVWTTVFALTAFLLLSAGSLLAAPVEVDLVAEKVNMTMPNTGEVIPMWGYRLAGDPAGSATVPGPTIRVTAADDLTVNLTNNLDQGPGLVEPTSLVIMGQTPTEANAMVPTWTDGTTGSRAGDVTKRVRSFTHEVAPGGTGTYEWGTTTGTLNPGTYLLQSGTHPAVQVQMGLYAVLVVDDAGAAGGQVHGQAYDSEQIMLFSEIDPALHAAVYTDNYGPGKAVTSTMEYDPKYYLLNGMPYTSAGDLAITGVTGENILVRFLNSGLRTRVPQVLEGAYLKVLAEDGKPAPFAVSRNSLMLPAAKTFDVLIENAPADSIPVFDRRLAFSAGASTNAITISGLGVFRNGTWYLDSDGSGSWTAGVDGVFSFGQAGDQAVAGDWNGDGNSQFGVFRNGTWYLDADNNGILDTGVDTVVSFGQAGDIPVVGDWNGDGNDQVGVFRNGTWYLDADGSGSWTPGVDTVGSFGQTGDRPVAGDWNGDGSSQIGVFRNGTWYLDADGSLSWTSGVDTVASFGQAGDIALAGDWNGDGTSQIGVFRSGTWYLDADGSFSWTSGVDTVATFGQGGDQPVSGSW